MTVGEEWTKQSINRNCLGKWIKLKSAFVTRADDNVSTYAKELPSATANFCDACTLNETHHATEQQ